MESHRPIRIALTGLGFLLLAAAAFQIDARAADRGCSNASLRGNFGFYRAGTTPTGELASLGLIAYDGHGNFAVTQSTSKAGNYSFDVTFAGTYAIDTDCTGAAFLDGVEFARLVVTDGGSGIYMFSESAGNAVYGVGRKITGDDD